jgi:hypothetical protein
LSGGGGIQASEEDNRFPSINNNAEKMPLLQPDQDGIDRGLFPIDFIIYFWVQYPKFFSLVTVLRYQSRKSIIDKEDFGFLLRLRLPVHRLSPDIDGSHFFDKIKTFPS